MTPSRIAHLGPVGTYAEQAAIFYAQWLTENIGIKALLCPFPSIFQTLQAVNQGSVEWAVVPVENSIQGSVTITLDTLWQLDALEVQLALVIPIAHALISHAQSLESIKIVHSHPQALAQCQAWLEKFLPQVEKIPTNSTTEALRLLPQNSSVAAISSQRAAQLYKLPILASNINDYPDNCTRFFIVSNRNSDVNKIKILPRTSHTSLAFSVPANIPGALVKPLQVLAKLGINMSRIESRPTKRSLGEYLFFIDIEADVSEPQIQAALSDLSAHTEVLKIFGSYNVLPTNY